MNRITSVVIVPIYEKKKEMRILFTKRNRKMKYHPGEISFPGGKVEEGETYEEAAKRETMEEINCPVTRTLGILKPVMTLVSDHLILPFIANINIKNIYLNKAEVESVHSISISELFKTKMKQRRFPHKRIYITSPVWKFSDFYVWGATGRILFDFKNWLKENELSL